MLESLHHFAHLFVHTFVCTYTFLGTSPGGLAAQIVTIATAELQGGWWKLSSWKANWRGGLRRAFYTLLVVWILTFVVCTVTTMYDDHQNLARRLGAVVNEKNALKVTLEQRDQYIKRLEHAGPQIITRTLPVPEAEAKCWFNNQGFYVVPPEYAKDSKSMLKVLIHCNRRVEAPFLVSLTLDGDFVHCDAHIANAGAMLTGGGREVRGKDSSLCEETINSPSLPAERLFVVTLYEAIQGQFPSITGGTVGSIKLRPAP